MTETTDRNLAVSEQDVNTLETFAEKSLQEAQTPEVLTKVPSLIQRGAIYLIGAALIVTLCLLYFGKVHVVVSANGIIIPKGEIVRVQALEGGVVTEILAHAGDRLPVGAPIIQLDVSESGLNLAELKRKLELQDNQSLSMHTNITQITSILSNPEGFPEKERIGDTVATGNTVQLVNALEKAKMELGDAKQNLERFQERKELLLKEIELTQENIKLLEKNREAASRYLAKEKEVLTKKKEALENFAKQYQPNYELKNQLLLKEIELTRENIKLLEKSQEAEAVALEKEAGALLKKKEQLEKYRQLAEKEFLSQESFNAEEEKYRAAENTLAASRKRFEQQNIEISNQRLHLADLERQRQLAEQKFLSKEELNLEEEKYRAAENALAESHKKFDQQEIEMSNQKLNLAELETKAQSEQATTEKNYRLAQINYKQTLNNLRVELENLNVQKKTLEAEIESTQGKIQMVESQISLTSISMPVSGMIAELKVSNPGELVSVGTVIATVVPDGVPLVVNATVPNKDIGFLKPGLEARIKIDAYPFQQFGTVTGRVAKVFPNTGNEKDFKIMLELLKDTIDVKGRMMPLFPGLTVQAELLTTKQRLLNLLFEKSGSGGKSGAKAM